MHSSYTYNEVGMLETLSNKESSSGNTRSSYDLSASNSYDGVFNMKACVASITGLSSLSGTLGWTVDSKDRLTNEAVTSGSRSSGSVTGTNAYDLAANLTTLRGTSGITHNSNNQITPSTGQWAYDGMGNPTKFRGRDCTYNLPGQMATMRDGNNWSMGYKYRSDGLIGSRAKTIYVLSRTGQWTPVTGNPTYFLHDGGEPLFELVMGSNFTAVSAINVRGPDGLMARKFSSNWTYYEFDQQGSVSQRLNSSGVVQSSSVYDAYGKETNNGSPSDPFGYNAQWGYWLDRETGMYLCQARWYDPVTARWVNRDPIGYTGGANLYGYCGGGPVGVTDTSGESDTKPGPPGTGSRYRADLTQMPEANFHIYWDSGLESVISARGGEQKTHKGNPTKKLTRFERQAYRKTIRTFVKRAAKRLCMIVIAVDALSDPDQAARDLVFADEVNYLVDQGIRWGRDRIDEGQEIARRGILRRSGGALDEEDVPGLSHDWSYDPWDVPR